MKTQGIRWQCPICNMIYTEAELNNQFKCPRCGVEQLTLLLPRGEYSYNSPGPRRSRERMLVR